MAGTTRGNLKVAFFNDFTGGLNTTASRQNLAPNESPDCQDVVFDNRGGFRTRRGYKTLTTQAKLNGGYIGGSFSAGTETLWGFNDDGAMWTYDGSTYTTVTTANQLDNDVVVTSAVWQNKLYFANWLSSSTYYAKHWNGSAFTTLTNTANNDYTNPTGGNAPLARLIANHSGHMWWADTTEGGNRYRSRIRFSHPLQPEDFAADDYFDIEPDDQTNQITALFPFRDMLLVFKRRGVWAVYGYDRESFVVERISTQAGVVCQHAVASSSGVCYWWSLDGNVFAFDGRGVVPVGERVRSVANDGLSVTGCLSTRLAWMDGQLYVSLRRTDNTRIMFMYDPAVGRDGAWTRFSFAPTSMYWWRRSGAAALQVFILSGQDKLFDFSDPDQECDTVGTADKVIPAYYRMQWYSAVDTALKKRWARPTVTVASKANATLIADVYHDFVESSPERTLQLSVQSSNDDGSMLWGTSNWGGASWADESAGVAYEFSRLPSCGRSNAIQIRFRMTGSLRSWWIDSVAIPYLEKAYR